MEGESGSSGRGPIRSAARLLPAVLVWTLAATTLVRFGTGWDTVLGYSLFLSIGVTLPGTLLWRALRGNTDGLVADIAFGTALGSAIVVLVYLPSRAVGVPLLGLAFPVLTVAAFLLVPRLRSCWRSGGSPMPWWWSVSVALSCAVGLGVVTRYGLLVEPLAFPAAERQYVDLPFQLALAGELKHQFPFQTPFVAGEPLRYHWFVHAYTASASWQTGIELDLLLRRLFPVFSTVLLVVGVAGLGALLARRRWAGALAAWLLLLVSSFDVYGWNGVEATSQNGFVTGVLMYSPTQVFAVLLSLPAVWVVAALLRAHGRDPGGWVLLAILLVGLGGAKPTTVPMIAAATLLAAVVPLLWRRRPDRTASIVCAAAVLVAVLSQLALFGRDTVGTTVTPLRTFKALAPRLGFSPGDATLVPLISTAATMTISWSLIGVGMLGLLRAPARHDPAAAFLIGLLLAGLGAASVLYQTGLSQVYFVRSAVPLAAAGSAWGLAVLLSGVRRRVLAPGLLAALAGGVVLAWAIGWLTPRRPAAGASAIGVAWRTTWPWLLVVAVVVLVALALRALPARRPLGVAAAAGFTLVLLLGTAAIRTPTVLVEAAADPSCAAAPSRPGCGRTIRTVPWQGAAAARWIRDHSDPGDVLATNSHCLPEYRSKECDARNFWLAGYAERRVLLEGWAYTPTAFRRNPSAAAAFYGPYWDKAFLAVNDAVFSSPTEESVASLRDRYGVRWLVFDRNLRPVPAALDRLLPRRSDFGAISVFHIPAGSAQGSTGRLGTG